MSLSLDGLQASDLVSSKGTDSNPLRQGAVTFTTGG
jgi:hypothetical protein